MKKRELWLDYLRAFACILVTLGHLFKSFQESSIRDTFLLSYTVETFYHFHVYIFFFCSGYLLQKVYQRYSDQKKFAKYNLIRCADFLIVYILFSGITFAIKLILDGNVNSPIEHTFVQTLLQHPINQMWYMYAIAIITLCTPMLKKQTAKIILAVSLVLKIVMCVPACSSIIPVPLNYLADHQIWYVMGCLWAYNKIVLKKSIAFVLAGVFFLVNTIVFITGIENACCNAVLTFLGIAASAGICYAVTYNKEKISFVWKLISKHMLPIYLLHTICAAGIRIILLRLGITNYGIHLVTGLLFSFAIPIICGEIARRTKILNIFFYPMKTIQGILK